MNFLEIQNARKGYGNGPNRTEVLSDIHLTVSEGEFVAIVGYSGTGKSTLINLISGLVHPDAGEARIQGKPITGPGPDRGLVFQNYSLLPWLTVEENVALAVDSVFKDWPSERRRAHVAMNISRVKLGHAAHKYPRELSGGMRQRVALARTLAMNPRVLLLDEPLSALDALTRAILQDEISEIWLANRTTVVWITNDPDEALLVADRVIPLLPTSPATLGEPLRIDLERPRDRKTIHHDPRFKALRAQLVQTLTEAKDRSRVRTSRKLHLPDLLPEDVSELNWFNRLLPRPPRRRGEVHREEVEVLS
jgi:nitrate/nitrite transport system ATP-binding protein